MDRRNNRKGLHRLTRTEKKQVGLVCLVGAGPGDPGLITTRGQELLKKADVIVYDALANPALLKLAKADAQRVFVGKRAAQHARSQEQINELLADHAQRGSLVVRLKGGDPYLFGRGAEEAAYLASRGVECQILPGITAGIAAPAYAGIPVTHRETASTVTFVTGHEDPTKDQSAIDYAALAALVGAGGTACFYMGMGRLQAISDQLQTQGLSADTPAAVIQWGTTPRQRSLRGTLANIAADAAAASLGAPAIIVIGPVAGMREPGLDYFTTRPLFGKTVVITRTRQQASDLRAMLDDLGALTLEAPTIELVPPQNWSEVDEAIQRISQYDWLVLTSANGVAALAQRLEALGLDARHFSNTHIAVIGEATGDSLRQQLAIRADLMPPRFVAESLAEELIQKHQVEGKRFLLLRADIARPALPKLLTQAGADVTELTVYQTKRPEALPDDVLSALRNNEVDWITFTSSSTARNMVDLLGDERGLLDRVKIASIGPITTDTLRELSLTPTIEATTSTILGVVEAITGAEASK